MTCVFKTKNRTFGNRQSCNLEYTECIADAFSDCVYDVTINGRFIGGEMLLRYGLPEINQEFFQANVPIP